MSFYVRLVAAPAFVALAACSDYAQSEAELRQQFHIPNDIKIAKVERPGRNHCNFGARVLGEVQFNEAQFAAYKASFSDYKVWKPTPLHHYNDDPAAYEATPEALRWRPISRNSDGFPFFAGNELPDSEGTGELLCYVVRVPTENLIGAPKGQGYSGIKLESCGARRHYETPDSFAVGYLDSDKRTLHMRLYLTNFPHYCSGSRTNQNNDLPF